jgi:ABC-2 type transport system ATP-binding protein
MIRVRNLVKTYGDFTAVQDVSFDVEEGEIFAFLGPNGAGKTTTMKMLTTILKPTSGTVEIDGLDPQVHQTDVRKRFGIVFQDASIDDDLTAWENMDLHGIMFKIPRPVRHARIEKLLTIFELWDRRDDLLKTYSGGMKRRVEIARAFLQTPRLMFMDEPTIGLDPQSRNHLWAQMALINQEERVTVFVTTHYLEEADRIAHRIAIIDHGRIIATGTPQDLKDSTDSETLEQAFLKITGANMRAEEGAKKEHLRRMGRVWGRR